MRFLRMLGIMINFELDLDPVSFEDVGMGVAFDDKTYSELVSELVPEPPQGPLLRVVIEPAPVMRMTKSQQYFALAGRGNSDYSSSYFNPKTKTIELSVEADQVRANLLLLLATRKWQASVTGELDQAKELEHQRRFVSRAMLVGPIAVLGALGAELSGQTGGIVGGTLGLVVGTAGEIIDGQRQPLNRSITDFVHDPEVLAKYGSILQLQKQAYTSK